MYSLAQGDITRLKTIEGILVSEAFTFLSYEADVAISDNIKI